MFQIFPSLKKVKVGSPRHFLSNNVRPTVPIFCKSFFGSKPATKLLKPVILFATFYMSRTVWGPTYRPERPKGAKDEVKRPEGPPAKSRGPESPHTSI